VLRLRIRKIKIDFVWIAEEYIFALLFRGA